MLERIIFGSKWLSGLAVWIALFSSLILYLAAIVSIFLAAKDFLFNVGGTEVLTKNAVIQALKTIDLVLIAVGLQIIASGIYQLFVNPEFKPPGSMEIRSFSQLKSTIAKVASIVLVIDFLESALDTGPGIEIFYYGAAIAIIVIAVAWSIHLEEKSKPS